MCKLYISTSRHIRRSQWKSPGNERRCHAASRMIGRIAFISTYSPLLYMASLPCPSGSSRPRSNSMSRASSFSAPVNHAVLLRSGCRDAATVESLAGYVPRLALAAPEPSRLAVATGGHGFAVWWLEAARSSRGLMSAPVIRRLLILAPGLGLSYDTTWGVVSSGRPACCASHTAAPGIVHLRAVCLSQHEHGLLSFLV